MTTKHLLIVLVLCGIPVALAAAVAFPIVAIIWTSLSPDTVSWDSKSAFVKCDGAIARNAWPDDPARACAAMHLCANEATLSDRRTAALRDMAKRTPGCGDF
jgi:hypothetical protein